MRSPPTKSFAPTQLFARYFRQKASFLPKEKIVSPYYIPSVLRPHPAAFGLIRYFSQKAWFLWKEKRSFYLLYYYEFPSILVRICFTNFFGKISFPCTILTLQFLIGFLYVVGRQLTSGLLTWNMSIDLKRDITFGIITGFPGIMGRVCFLVNLFFYMLWRSDSRLNILWYSWF